MRILVVSNLYPPFHIGGYERRCSEVVHGLQKRGHAFRGDTFPLADRIARQSISLPTWGGLTREDVRFVCDSLLEYIESRSREFSRLQVDKVGRGAYAVSDAK